MGFRRKSAQFLPDGRKIGIGLQDDGVVRALHAAPQTAGLVDARQDEKIFGTFGQYGFRNRGRRLERRYARHHGHGLVRRQTAQGTQQIGESGIKQTTDRKSVV